VSSGIVENENFECKMYIIEQEPTEFESANPKQYPRIGHFMNLRTGGSKTG
jgi:hypothetical protein